MSSDLISARTRREFQEHLVGWVLRDIEALFDDEGVRHDPAAGLNVTGQRRAMVAQYYATVDWTSWSDVRKVLRVYESVLISARRDSQVSGSVVEGLERYLALDGYTVDEQGRIRRTSVSQLGDVPVSGLADAAAIETHLHRMTEAMDADPALAISQAKAAVEATTKLVLKEMGQPFDEKADVPALVKQAQKALGLHPETMAPTSKGAEIIKRMLSNLSQLAVGLAELRNEYGPDHGRSASVGGLAPRHAHLAVCAAHTYCRLLLETMEDPAAPWREPAAS